MSSLRMKTWIANGDERQPWLEVPRTFGAYLKQARQTVSDAIMTHPPTDGKYTHVLSYDELVYQGEPCAFRIVTDEAGTILKEQLVLTSGEQWWQVVMSPTMPEGYGSGGYKLRW